MSLYKDVNSTETVDFSDLELTANSSCCGLLELSNFPDACDKALTADDITAFKKKVNELIDDEGHGSHALMFITLIDRQLPHLADALISPELGFVFANVGNNKSTGHNIHMFTKIVNMPVNEKKVAAKPRRRRAIRK